MIRRSFDRSTSQARPVKITPQFGKFSLASVLCEYGDTKVVCSVSMEETTPRWMRQQRGRGWLYAEYSLLPSSTPERTHRERNGASGRTQEIQRLISRALRSSIDLNLIGERTLIVDCDVVQADGGTRTASITGGYVALKLAIDKLLKEKKIKVNPLRESVAAVSVGLVDGEMKVDLDYQEDTRAQADLNVVATSAGGLIEVQGGCESYSFTRQQLDDMVRLAQNALVDIFAEQNTVCM